MYLLAENLIKAKEILSGVIKKNRDKIVFSFSDHIQGQKNNFITKKNYHSFLPKFGSNLAYFAQKTLYQQF